MEILLITTPAQHSTSNKAVIQDPKKLSKWVSELPVMNVIETVQLLQNAISSFNEHQMDHANRFKLLNIYYDALEEILFSYDEIRLHTLPVSTEKRKAISEDIMWLYLGLANGYKILVKQGYDEKLNPKRNVELLTSIFRAMELILNAIVYAYKANVSIPPLSQLELKQLYSFGMRNSAHETVIKSIKNHAFSPTISNIYKHFILFHALEPQNLESIEILDFFLVLESYASNCLILHDHDIEPDKFKYITNINDDEPVSIYKSTLVKEQESTIIIDIQPAIQAAQKFISESGSETQNLTEKKELKLLQFVINHFTGSTPQKSSTTELQQTVKVISDFSAIINLIQNKEKITELTNIEYIGGIEVSNIDEEISNVVSDWKIIDENEALRVLAGTPPKDTHLDVGDIIGIVEKIDNYASGILLLAVIRKVRTIKDNSVKLAIEIIPGQAAPVVYKGIDSQQHTGAYFPQIPALQRPASLLVEKQFFAQENLSVNTADKWVNIQAVTTLLDLPNFILFDFRPT